MEAEEVIEKLGLVKHREGGWFGETYRASESVAHRALPERYTGGRSFSTAIYYLITADDFSAMHRVASDEIFHFYAGDPVLMLQLGPERASRRVMLGADLGRGQRPQAVVKAGWWQGLRMAQGGKWALMGATVAPGFEYEDFTMGVREELEAGWPDERDLIGKLTR